MKLPTFLSLFCIIFHISYTNGVTVPKSRIIGGGIADISSFPYQAGILLSNGWCGGVLISENYVLSSAKCLESAQTGTVLLGVTGMVDIKEVVAISSILLHELFNAETLENDIALVKLNRPAVLGEKVQPINLPARRNTLTDYSGQIARVSGWGSVNGIGEVPPVEYLHYADVQVISALLCRVLFPVSIFTSNICTSSGDGAPCFGDEGGPLTVNVDGVTTLIGLISHTSTTRCSQTIPAVYVRIPSLLFLNWIGENSDVEIAN